MKLKTILLTLTALTLSLSAANAAKPGKGEKGSKTDYNPEEVVKKFDKNADNKLSLEEYSAMKKFSKEADPKAAAKTAFESQDTNKDNFVTAEEMKAAHDKKIASPKAPTSPDKKPETKPEAAK
jgi:hypothetical protein